MIWENFIVIYGYKIALAIIIFFVGKKLASWVTELLVKTVAKSNSVDVTLENFLRSVVYSILIVVVILASLAQLGIETTSFVAILGAAGLAIGLAFKDTLSNISAGVMLMIFRPIKIGEFVETAGISANVESINIFHTTFKTGDNKLIIVGNAKVIASNIINYSRKETRRVDLEFGISYEDTIPYPQLDIHSKKD
ncbi:MAG: mechanosensitive ion channel [Campylobacterales bacterium]|nr:mechanosensitive ion channel [Campylobacterales bacterium]